VVAADHHGERPRPEDVGDLRLDVAVRARRLPVGAVGVPGIDDVEPLEQVQPEVEVVGARVVRRGSKRPRTEPRTGAVGGGDVQRGADDRDVRVSGSQRLGRGDPVA
jgi:hypothetical protein